MSNQQQQLIRSYQRRIEALEKPKMRITNKRKRKLITGAVFADLAVDPIGGLLPVIGDIGSATLIHYGFKSWFWSYEIDGSKYIDKSKTISDAAIGLFPAVGDFLDLLFLSWTWTIYSAVKEVREKDKKRIKEYNKTVRRLQRELQYRLKQLQTKQTKQSQIRNVSDRQETLDSQRSQIAPVPTSNAREKATNVAPTQYNNNSTS